MSRVELPDGRLFFVAGSSGSGKTAWVRQRLEGESRVLVWDVEDQYGDIAERVTERADLVERLAPGAQRLAFVPARCSRAYFDWWARVAFVWGRMGAMAGCRSVVVAEEIADVTHAGKAPEAWGRLVRRGRKWAIDRYVITQRPAESDKTSIGNATVIHCGRLAMGTDRAYMAARMDIERAELELAPLEYVETDEIGALSRGRLRFE